MSDDRTNEMDGLWWHRVGQRVVCVDDRQPLLGALVGMPQLTKDAVYEITKVEGPREDPRLKNIHFLLRGHDNWGWFASRFRPVRETSIDSFLSLLNPTPDDVPEMEEVV